MRRIGVYSGTFDPPHKGHIWVIEEACKLFDEVDVVVGSPSGKDIIFSVEERIDMLNQCIPDKALPAVQMHDENIVRYIKKIPIEAGEQVFFIRGVRDANDFDFEKKIWYHMQEFDDDLHHVFVIPPLHISQISSRAIKKLCRKRAYQFCANQVDPYVFARLKRKYDCVSAEKHNFYFDGPSSAPLGNYEVKVLQDDITISSCSGHPIEIKDEVQRVLKAEVEKNKANIYYFGKMKSHFDLMKSNNLLMFQQTITGDQVRKMLDLFPVDLVVSEVFNLQEISLDSVSCVGPRCLPCSQSLGPILVEANEVLPQHGHLAERCGVMKDAIVIEGKHRWWDAKDRGDKTIQAWVGDKVDVAKLSPTV